MFMYSSRLLSHSIDSCAEVARILLTTTSVAAASPAYAIGCSCHEGVVKVLMESVLVAAVAGSALRQL